MKYLYEALSEPARLYIKQCPHCNMKYFGKTTAPNIEKYTGSGKRWKHHIEKHNVTPIHLWNSDWYHDTSIKRFALKFSRMNKIVESSTWANLIEEDGIDGVSSQGATAENYKRMEEGSHPFCDPLFNQKTNEKRQETMNKNKSHNFLGGEIQRNSYKRRVESGEQLKINTKISQRVKKEAENGVHPMQRLINVVDTLGNIKTIPKADYKKDNELVHVNSLEGKKRLGKSIEPTEKQLAYREKLKSKEYLDIRIAGTKRKKLERDSSQR